MKIIVFCFMGGSIRKFWKGSINGDFLFFVVCYIERPWNLRLLLNDGGGGALNDFKHFFFLKPLGLWGRGTSSVTTQDPLVFCIGILSIFIFNHHAFQHHWKSVLHGISHYSYDYGANTQ